MTKDLEILRTQSLTSVIREQVKGMILSGELKAGEKLNENELAKRLAVSRGPVREALRGLEQTGLVTGVVNRGVFVRSLSRKEMIELHDIRSALARQACISLARHITSEQIAFLSRLVERMGHETDVEAYYPLNLEFHARIMDFCGNTRLAELYLACVDELHLYRRLGLVHGGGLKASNREHRKLLDALVAGDPGLAGRMIEKHFQEGKKRILKAMDS